MKLSMEQSSSPFWDGVRDAIPIVISFLFLFFAIGEAGSAAGLDIFQNLGMTLLVFASPAQLVLVESISKHTWWTIPLATGIINFRFMLMSALLVPYFQSQSKSRILAALPILSASTFAVSFVRIKEGEQYPFEYFLGVAGTSCLAATLATILGAVVGVNLPTELAQLVSMVLPIHFTMLVGKAWPKLRVIIAGILGFVLTPLLDHYFANWGLMLAPLTIGIAMMLTEEKND